MANEYMKPLDENGLAFLWQQILLNFVKKEMGKGLSTHDLTDALLQKINDAGTSSFDGDYDSLTSRPSIGGVTLTGNKTLADLGITTAIADAITTALGGITQIDYQTVESFADLPTTGAKGVFYLVPNAGGSGNNNYDEYIWNGTAYELIGQIQTEIDLSDYLKRSEIAALTNDEISTIISNVTNATA